jgi:very-short-patch-repair endonuclease
VGYDGIREVDSISRFEVIDVSVKARDFDPVDLYRAHEQGESLLQISNRIAVSRSAILRQWKSLGFKQRDRSRAGLNRAGAMSPEARKRQAEAAHGAVRGKKQTFEHLQKKALFKERNPPAMTQAESTVFAVLNSIYPVTRERACGSYNIDFALGAHIAVECFGGMWHATGRRAARHEKRVRYLLDAGFDVVIVWVENDDGLRWAGALRETITDLYSASREPSPQRQYRVIWSDGNVVYSRTSDDDDFPFVFSPGRTRNASGRYERAG